MKLKQAEVIPSDKKHDLLKKENYRPFSFLLHLSTVLEKTNSFTRKSNKYLR